MKVDMSPEAVTARLIRTSQLRELCLSLRQVKAAVTPPPRPANDGHARAEDADDEA